MGETIEGEWNQYIIKLVRPEDYPRILEHLTTVFYRDEALFKLAGYSDDLANEVNEVVRYYLNKNDQLSLFAVDKTTNKVAGVRLTFEVKRNQQSNIDDFIVNCPEHKKILEFILPLFERTDIHEQYGVESYADFFMTSVDPDFRGQGLVTEFYRRSLLLLQSRGLTVAKSMFSSPHTRRAASKFGFQEVFREYFHEAVDAKGDQLFPGAEKDEFTALMVKQLV